MRVLIVEDEIRLAEALSEILSKQHYTVDTAYDGLTGLDRALSGIYDVIILDIMLPKLDGYAILKSLRQERIAAPVLMLSAKDETGDKVRGLDQGADDYLTKPFSTEELLARIRALNRRQNEFLFENRLCFGDFSLQLSDATLACGKKTIALSKKECELLQLLMQRKGNLVSKEEIIEKIWGYDALTEYNNVEVYISFLRKKMAHVGSISAIKTVRSAGYCLKPIEETGRENV